MERSKLSLDYYTLLNTVVNLQTYMKTQITICLSELCTKVLVLSCSCCRDSLINYKHKSLLLRVIWTISTQINEAAGVLLVVALPPQHADCCCSLRGLQQTWWGPATCAKRSEEWKISYNHTTKFQYFKRREQNTSIFNIKDFSWQLLYYYIWMHIRKYIVHTL